MGKTFKIKKGLNIPLQGSADKQMYTAPQADMYAVKPTDFHGLTPKLLLKSGAKVKAGEGLFFDKYKPEVIFASPVSGEVTEVVRGERRRILEVIIKPDAKVAYKEFDKKEVKGLSKDDTVSALCEAGLWPFVIQRPYDVIANPADTPKAIFVSGFDSHPLAPEAELVVKGNEAELQAGLTALSNLTEGAVNFTQHNDQKVAAYASLSNVELHTISGPHPSGNVSTQIANISPINKGDLIWTVKLQDVIAMGALFTKGIYDASRVVAVTGSEVVKTGYYTMSLGARVSTVLDGNVTKGTEVRYISGNVLTGTQISATGYLGSYHNQITVIPEGKEFKFFGWAWAGHTRFTTHNVYLSRLFSKKIWKLDANLNGGERAFIVSGEYDKVIPLDILPEFLVKAVITKDLDKMEQLGIYEVAPEDFALAEFTCTSKIETQYIVREGLDYLKTELG